MHSGKLNSSATNYEGYEEPEHNQLVIYKQVNKNI